MIAYLTDGTDLFSVDLSDGSTTDIGEITALTSIAALAIDGAGNVYAAGGNKKLYAVDTGTGAGTEIGTMGVGNWPQGMTFGPDGVLYLATAPTYKLYSIDPADATATEIGSLGSPYNFPCLGANQDIADYIFSIADNGTSDYFYQIATADAAITEIGEVTNAGTDVFRGVDCVNGTWYAFLETAGEIWTVDEATGAGTYFADLFPYLQPLGSCALGDQGPTGLIHLLTDPLVGRVWRAWEQA